MKVSFRPCRVRNYVAEYIVKFKCRCQIRSECGGQKEEDEREIKTGSRRNVFELFLVFGEFRAATTLWSPKARRKF